MHERLLFTHSVSVFVSTPLAFSLAACRASGASLASSQEVKLNCRARLPNDERLRHPGMLRARTESSEREKMLAFQLNVFFPAFFFVCVCLLFWCQFLQHEGELLFFFIYLRTQVLAPQPWSESASWETGGWTDGCSEEEDCKSSARDDVIVFVLVCGLNVDVQISSLLHTI